MYYFNSNRLKLLKILDFHTEPFHKIKKKLCFFKIDLINFINRGLWQNTLKKFKVRKIWDEINANINKL